MVVQGGCIARQQRKANYHTNTAKRPAHLVGIGAGFAWSTIATFPKGRRREAISYRTHLETRGAVERGFGLQMKRRLNNTLSYILVKLMLVGAS